MSDYNQYGYFDFLLDINEEEMYSLATDIENLCCDGYYVQMFNTARQFLECTLYRSCENLNLTPEYHKGRDQLNINATAYCCFKWTNRLDLYHNSIKTRIELVQEFSHYDSDYSNEKIGNETVNQLFSFLTYLCRWYLNDVLGISKHLKDYVIYKNVSTTPKELLIKKLKEDIETLNTEKNMLSDSNIQLTEKIVSIENKNNELNSKLVEVKTENSQLQKEVNKIKTHQLNTSNNDNLEIDKLKNKINILTQKNKDLILSYKTQENEFKEIIATNKNYMKKFKEYESLGSVDSIKLQLSNYEKSEQIIKDISKERDDIRKICIRLKSQLENINKNVQISKQQKKYNDNEIISDVINALLLFYEKQCYITNKTIYKYLIGTSTPQARSYKLDETENFGKYDDSLSLYKIVSILSDLCTKKVLKKNIYRPDFYVLNKTTTKKLKEMI